MSARDQERALLRIADALERLANFFEQQPPTKPIEVPVVVKLDGRTLWQGMTRYSFQQASRGPSTLTGGSLASGAE